MTPHPSMHFRCLNRLHLLLLYGALQLRLQQLSSRWQLQLSWQGLLDRALSVVLIFVIAVSIRTFVAAVAIQQAFKSLCAANRRGNRALHWLGGFRHWLSRDRLRRCRLGSRNRAFCFKTGPFCCRLFDGWLVVCLLLD